MKLLGLHLARYGHFTDATLDFPADAGLHIVLGANEAGKSTALAAVADALFGFGSLDMSAAFQHQARDLRIGIRLRTADGRQAAYVRRKGRSDTLRNENDQPVPDGTIAALLGGMTRRRFLSLQGLNAAELRRGGESILTDGEVGENLLAAQTGLRGFRAHAERLAEEAAKIHGSGRRLIAAQLAAYRAAREQRDARIVRPAQYKEASEEQEGLEKQAHDDSAKRQSLQATRAVLDRVRRTHTARHALARAEQELVELGPLPPLPEDAEQQYRDAVQARTTAAVVLERETAQAEDLQRKLDGLDIDAALLAEGDKIDRLSEQRVHAWQAAADLPKQQAQEAQHLDAVLEAARALGLPADAEALARSVPGPLARSAVTRAVAAYAKRQGRLDAALQASAEAEQAAGAAVRRREALAVPEDTVALRAAIDAAKAEGRIDALRAEAEGAIREAESAVVQALAALPLWDGSATELAALPVPLDADIAAAAAALIETAESQRTHAAGMAGHENALDQIGAALAGLAARGELATTSAITDARHRRDRAWALLRLQFAEGGQPPSVAELTELGAEGGLWDRFESLLRLADSLADRRADDVERVVEHGQLMARQAETTALRAKATEHEAVARQRHESAAARWAALWCPTALVPSDPAAMREWLSARMRVLELQGALAKSQAHAKSLASRRDAIWAALAALVPADAEAAVDRMAALVQAAEARAAAREAERKAWDEAVRTEQAALETATKARQSLEDAERSLAEWRAEWAPVVATLGLGADTPPEDAQLALERWSRIEASLEHWRTARNRADDMSRVVQQFDRESAAVAGHVAPDLTDLNPDQRVQQLSSRVAEARAVNATQLELQRQLSAAGDATQSLKNQIAATENTLAVLRTLAGVADEAALLAIIGRVARRAELNREIAARNAELRQQDDGRSRADLDAEAAGHEVDDLPSRITQIDAELEALRVAETARVVRQAQLRDQLAEMVHGKDAVAAQQDMENAAAEIGTLAARYARLRMAETLLRSAIDTFRRRQQGPLLARAGALFGAMTEGRYERLDVELGKADALMLAAVLPDGRSCPADRLSEGTRDQLFLALRLAAIEGAAQASEPLPFIADDLLAGFDDARARAALSVLADFGTRTTQVILFTHHAHIAAMAPAGALVQHLAAA